MDLSEVDPEEGFSFIWTIQNYSDHFYRDLKEYKSPEFVLSEDDAVEKWNVNLWPISSQVDDTIGIYLKRSPFEASVKLTFEVSVRTLNGIYKVLDRKRLFEVRRDSVQVGKLKIRKTEDLKAYLNDDSLTIKCRISKVDDKLLAPRKCCARTIVDIQRINYNCTIEGLQDLENGKTVTKHLLILSQFPLFKMKFGTINDDDIYIRLSQIEGKKCYSTCYIAFIDANGEIFHTVEDEYQFVPDSFSLWRIPAISLSKLLSNKNLYLPNGILSLCCEFDILSGIIKYNEVESTVYGKSRDHQLETQSDFRGSLKDNLQCFYIEGKMSDLTIRTPNKEFPVHKAILCARSEVFKAMFERDMIENRTGVVEIEDIDEDTVAEMLLFVYTDTLGEKLEWETASNLYFAADKYGIVALKGKCSDFLRCNFTLTNVCEGLLLADMHQDEELKAVAQNFICEHHAEIIGSEEWKIFMEENAHLASKTMHSLLLKRL